MHLVIATLLVICVALPSSATQQRETSTSSGVLSGRVTNLFGEQLEGAVVQVLPFSRLTNLGEPRIEVRNHSLEATSNSQGDYSIGGISPGVYTVSVELRGFRRVESCQVALHRGVNAMDFGLEVGVNIDVSPFEINGRVQRPDGSPIADATVTIISVFNRDLREQTRTDQNGRYKIAISTPGQYILYASKAKFSPAAKGLVTSERGVIDFTLSRMP